MAQMGDELKVIGGNLDDLKKDLIQLREDVIKDADCLSE